MPRPSRSSRCSSDPAAAHPASKENPMTRFANLGHVALKTRDIDRSLAFYTGQLGMPEMLRLLFDDGSLFLIYLKITDNQYLELFPDGLGDRAPGRDAVAVNHFCLGVEDIERSVADLEAAG